MGQQSYIDKNGRRRCVQTFDKPSRTRQTEKDSSDINNIMRKYEKTGQLDQLRSKNPSYGDFSSIPDYQEGLNTVLRAQSQFNSLPARIRRRFDNDPKRLLAFVADPANREEMVTLGLIKGPHRAEPPASDRPSNSPSEGKPAAGSGGGATAEAKSGA